MSQMYFKFEWVREGDETRSNIERRGILQANNLILDELKLPLATIIQSVADKDNLTISLQSDGDNTQKLTIETQSARQLQEELDRVRQSGWRQRFREHTDAYQLELESEAGEASIRKAYCPRCDSVLDSQVVHFSPQLSCMSCHAIFMIGSLDHDVGETMLSMESGYTFCEDCGMYSKPCKFTIFYFFLPVILYGFYYKRKWCCPPCMRGDAWRMLLGNLPFVLGVPVSIKELIRAYQDTGRGGVFHGLNTANHRARIGDVEGAMRKYREILERRPENAGVRYNLATALMQENRFDDAAVMLKLALADCANFQPAVFALASCYEYLRDYDQLAGLEFEWKQRFKRKLEKC